jgi:mono/diheme cytochrome c family protein
MTASGMARAALAMAATLPLACLSAAAGNGEPRGDAARGAELYREKCSLCHGARGAGWDWSQKVQRPPVPVPDLASVAPTRSDQYLFDVVREGGEAVGRTRFMPAFGFQLSDADVWDVVAYLRTLAPRP